MTSNLLTSSAIPTKIKAMQSKLVTADDLIKICSLHSTAEFVSYLKNIYDYKEIFTHVNETMIHRGAIESMLTYSKYMDFLKIYQFADLSTRAFLDIFFLRFEIDAIKECLRCAMDPDVFDFDANVFEDFFLNHTTIHPQQLLGANDIKEFIQILSNTVYYDILKEFPPDNDHLFEMEAALELYFYKTYWNYQKKYLKGANQKTIQRMIGAEIDLQNISLIFRLKANFNLPSSSIYRHILPICGFLKKYQLINLMESSSNEEFETTLSKTYYGRYLPDFKMHPDHATELILLKIQKLEVRKNPCSVAGILTFLYHKSNEIHTLTTALECIRYQLPTNEIREYLKDYGNLL